MPDEPLEASSQPVRPDWLEANFDSVEAQARSYSEARKQMREALDERDVLRQERDQYAEALYDMESTPEPEPSFDPGSNPLVAQMARAYEEGDVQTMLAMNAYIANQIVESKLAEQQAGIPQGPDPTQTEMYALMTDNLARDKYEQRYGESWDAIRAEAADLLLSMPDLVENLPESPAQSADRLIFAAEHVRNRQLLAGQERPTTSMQPNPRLLSQTLPGAGQAPASQDPDAEKWERIMNAPNESWQSLRMQK